jgi:ABC-type sugar transport system ATPase subunit
VNTFVATFLGSPPMNLVEDARDGTRLQVGVRPEDIDVALSPGPGYDDARVLVVEPMGSETLVTLEYRAQRLVARVSSDRTLEPGQAAYVRLPPDRVLRFATDTGERLV